MYKTHVMNNNNNDAFKNNLFKNEFIFFENDEKKPFFENFEDDFEEKIEKSEDVKIKNNYIFKNNRTLSIIDEENVNDKNNEIFPLENEKDKEKDKEKENVKSNEDNMEIDDSFENNHNNVFNLDFEKIIKENDNINKFNDLCFYGAMCDENHYHNFCPNNDCKFNRQNSFDSLPFNG